MLWVILIVLLLVAALLLLLLMGVSDIQDQLSMLNQTLRELKEPVRSRGVPDVRAMAEARALASRRGPGAPTKLPSLDGRDPE